MIGELRIKDFHDARQDQSCSVHRILELSGWPIYVNDVHASRRRSGNRAPAVAEILYRESSRLLQSGTCSAFSQRRAAISRLRGSVVEIRIDPTRLPGAMFNM